MRVGVGNAGWRGPGARRRSKHRMVGALAFAVALGGCAPSEAPPSSELVTRAEASGFLETSRYAEVVAFMEAAARASDRVHLTRFGYTWEGRSLPLAVVGDVDGPSPESVAAAGKTVVYLQGNIHGGEVCGKEALLMLLREIARGDHAAWDDSLVLLVAPVYNADGNERIALDHRPGQHGPMGGMGQRPNAQGYDLNRDHMKLDSPEARSFVGLLNAYDPHVTVDLHTTDGTRHGYHLTYSPPLHPATAPPLVRHLREALLPEVTRRVGEELGWDLYYYGNAFPLEDGADPSWVTFDHRPRFNNNYVGLRNRLAILSEAYAYATFEDRVTASLVFVRRILDSVHGSSAGIRRMVAEADGTDLVGDSMAVRATFQRSAEPVTILMGEVEREVNPWSGRPVLRRLDVQRPIDMYEHGTFQATERAAVSAAYLIPPGGEETDEVLERLRVHGIRTSRLQEERTLPVEIFRVDSVRVAERPFQGRREHEVTGRYVEERRTLPAGSVVVPMDQPLARLAFQLLEPRADDGFLAWDLWGGEVEEGMPYPVFRSRAAVEAGAPGGPSGGASR